MQYLYHLAHVVRAVLEVFAFLIRKVKLYDLLGAPRTELHRDANEKVVDAVLALQVGSAGEDALLVEQDRVDYLDDGGRRRIEGAPTPKEIDDFCPALSGALHDLIHLVWA